MIFRLSYLFFALCISTSATLTGQTSEALGHFDHGNVQYHAGEFHQAIESYQLALEAGFESAALHNNLGNAYYRLDEIGNAIVEYERGLELDSELEELRHSITLARTRTVDQFSRVPEPFWRLGLRKLNNIASVGMYFGIGIGLYFIAILLFGLRIFKKNGSSWIRRLSTLTATFAGILILLAFLISISEASLVRYVFVGNETAVLSEPDELADIETRIHEGIVFDYLAETEGWIQVRLPNGVTGWVVNEDLVRL